tara:strand:+ start:1497 stop:1643 length:147 start_codon:yes stop_codon:yes gene_type:complete
MKPSEFVEVNNLITNSIENGVTPDGIEISDHTDMTYLRFVFKLPKEKK